MSPKELIESLRAAGFNIVEVTTDEVPQDCPIPGTKPAADEMLHGKKNAFDGATPADPDAEIKMLKERITELELIRSVQELALKVAKAQFMNAAQHHMAKNTGESLAKAGVNIRTASIINMALNPPK